MKKLIILTLSLFVMAKVFGQIHGITYQAVIIDKNPQEVPGIDISGNILPNHPVQVRFTILDDAGTIEYQEEHSTSTDAYGMINLLISSGTVTSSSPNTFVQIDWNGTPKDLKVDISLSTTEVFYTDFSFEKLTFVPYAYHKNITATGSMIIDGVTNLKSRVNVTNGSPTFLSGRLTVDSTATIQKTLTVNAPSSLQGQVTINANVDGDKTKYESYPLKVQGSNQGIAIKIDGTRSSGNNFVTFWDNEAIQGRIEGQTTGELLSDPGYIFDNILFANELIRSTVDVAKAIAGIASASSSSTVCAGLGACVTAPVPSLIVGSIAQAVMDVANLALAIAEPVVYNISVHENIGVSYQSGAGDYAEWLPKSNLSETFSPGDIVGVRGGQISISTESADHYMVISHQPIVLGNMPDQGKEANYEKVAFMGQVSVKVLGRVQAGDYILPSGNNNGAGIAISPDNIQPEQFQKIVGIAWASNESQPFSFVNVAVGLNANDVARLSIKQEKKIEAQEAEINSLKSQLNQMNNVLAQLIPNYATLMQVNPSINTKVSLAGQNSTMQNSMVQSQSDNQLEKTIVYYEVTREQILEGIDMAERILRQKGVDISKNPLFTKFKSESGYKENFINEILISVNNQIKDNYSKDAQAGAKVIKL